MAVVVLAAGFSGRMGKPKWSLPFDEKQTFIERITQTYLQAGCGKVVLVLNREGVASVERRGLLKENRRVLPVLNPFPEKERFFSVQTGLKALQDHPAVFLQNVDNPFVTSDILFCLAGSFRAGAYVVPQYGSRNGHPILLSGKIAGDLVASSNEKENLRRFLRKYPKIICPVQNERILLNINTPEAYRRVFGKADF